jgi:hypothetical protein
MKKLNFQEMEIINAGQALTSSTWDLVGADGQRLNWCFIEC